MSSNAAKMTIRRRITFAFAVAIAAAAVFAATEAFIHTRFQSAYIPAAEYSARSLYLLTGHRERGHLVEVAGKGFHSAEPSRTPQDLVEMLRERYPYDFDEKKIIWVLRDEEGAFFYNLSPNSPALTLLSVLMAIAIFVALCKIECRTVLSWMPQIGPSAEGHSRFIRPTRP